MRIAYFKQHTWLLLAAMLLPAHPAIAKKRIFGDPAAATGTLKTKVKPSDAAVYVDGSYVGHADQFDGPGQKLHLTPGPHDVRFSIAYYQDYSTRVNVEAHETAVIRQSLNPSDEQPPKTNLARVKIHVKPLVKTAVIVNGRFVGHADQVNGPGQVLVVEAGHYTVVLAHAGYKPHTTEFDIGSEETKTITAILETDTAVPYSEQ